MITASHNPPSDNGFKCYNSAGAQVIPPDDAGIIACVEAASSREIPELDFEQALAAGTIRMVDDSLDRHYLEAVVAAGVRGERDAGVVYTPLHGVGETSCAAALALAGFPRVEILASERTPDGDFPNVPGHVSNPEIPKTLNSAINRARELEYDLVVASDPDADRIGIGVPVAGESRSEWTTLDGNQIGAVLASFVIEESKARGLLRPEHYLVTTLVTSQLVRAIVERYGLVIEDDLLVGFKWIAKRIDEKGPENFLFGFEESHGYVKGTHVRDKDAAIATLLAAQLASSLKARGKTVLEYLDDLYLQFGHYGERLINKVMEGRAGAEQIQTLMTAFREAPPSRVGGLAVRDVYDYETHEVRRADGSRSPLPEPSGDLVIFHLDAPGARFAARPSGTEPKIKFYLFARTDTAGLSDRSRLAGVKQRTRQLLDAMESDIHAYVAEVVGG
jgi:phosphoglucomutase/phosphomannomutase